jgi:hypothetical protein
MSADTSVKIKSKRKGTSQRKTNYSHEIVSQREYTFEHERRNLLRNQFIDTALLKMKFVTRPPKSATKNETKINSACTPTSTISSPGMSHSTNSTLQDDSSLAKTTTILPVSKLKSSTQTTKPNASSITSTSSTPSSSSASVTPAKHLTFARKWLDQTEMYIFHKFIGEKSTNTPSITKYTNVLFSLLSRIIKQKNCIEFMEQFPPDDLEVQQKVCHCIWNMYWQRGLVLKKQELKWDDTKRAEVVKSIFSSHATANAIQYSVPCPKCGGRAVESLKDVVNRASDEGTAAKLVCTNELCHFEFKING